VDALLWAIPAALALIAAVPHCSHEQARTLLSATACLWIAALAVIIARS
jgi:hypothetical protein